MLGHDVPHLLAAAGWRESAANWGRLLRIMDIEQYHAKNSEISADAVLELMIFDADNPQAS